ncbi:lasso peptide biosynthesis B2 protein [Amycolatopsis sp. CA-230715]|uniref:lasso peptide biosynthesis B2 protein n=1 Tax=Amycolatopsis sp. CA-230715 TaxID=2745196 RepID=UPI001C33BFC3|nr:lasso peptide biosynthesis B2 protein [Amycolatopsis sp. CA-230715]QWF85066.1 hypothetical protein HUW46_08519 [Amycolatopsis sp. CA-230715]
MSQVLPEIPTRTGLGGEIVMALALVSARILSRQSPRRLRRVLGRVAAGTRPASYAQAALARDQILTFSPRCRAGNTCLPRSIAVLLVCRARGIWPTLCVGVIATPPFRAHAWIEVDEQVVGEPVDSAFYRKFFSVPCGGSDGQVRYF